MISIKQISRTVLALAATLAVGSAMAASATVELNAPLMTANGVTATAIGNDTYNGSTGVLTAPISAGQTATFADFGNADGFSLAFKLLGFPQTIAFSNFGFDSLTRTLSGNLLGGGLVLSKINYVGGDLLSAGTSTIVGNDIVYSNFTVSTQLSDYLTSIDVDTNQLSAVTSVVKTISIPSVSAVPEPSAYALMGLGLVGIALATRKRRA